jgi:hypothetical protein
MLGRIRHPARTISRNWVFRITSPFEDHEDQSDNLNVSPAARNGSRAGYPSAPDHGSRI